MSHGNFHCMFPAQLRVQVWAKERGFASLVTPPKKPLTLLSLQIPMAKHLSHSLILPSCSWLPSAEDPDLKYFHLGSVGTWELEGPGDTREGTGGGQDGKRTV